MLGDRVHERFRSVARAAEVGIASLFLEILDPDQWHVPIAGVMHDLAQGLVRDLPGGGCCDHHLPAVELAVGQHDGAT